MVILRSRKEACPWRDEFPGIPFGYNLRGTYIRFSRDEREKMFLGKKKLPKKEKSSPSPKEGKSSSNLSTVKRGGKWVQVGEDNLSAFIANK